VIEREDFGQYVEQRHRQYGARTESKQQVKPVAHSDGGRPAQPGRDEGYQGK
jgi:hypothetical protein